MSARRPSARREAASPRFADMAPDMSGTAGEVSNTLRRMTLRVTLATLSAAVLLAGCGHGPRAEISLRVEAYGFTAGAPEARIRTLTCRPTGGTLPFAARICSDLARQPNAMLRPAPPQCVTLGGPWPTPRVHVTGDARGRRVAFSGEPSNCDAVSSVYADAAWGSAAGLVVSERWLRCLENPGVSARTVTFLACHDGSWSPHARRLIRAAATVREVAALHRDGVFPRNVGVRECRVGERGLCAVYLHNAWSSPMVSFVVARGKMR